MKYIVPVVVLALCACIATNSQFFREPETSVPEEIFQHNINIKMFEDGNLLGSGTYIEFNSTFWVITANHVATIDSLIANRVACHKLSWYMNTQEECVDITDAPIYIIDGFDVALIQLPGPLANATPANVVPNYWWRLGESIYTSGWPNGNYALNHGTITGGDMESLIRTDTPYWFGISGGGVFNYEGNLIGIAYELEAGATPMGTEVVEGNKHFTLIPIELFSAAVYN